MMVLTEYLRTLDIIQSFTIVVGTLQFSVFSRRLHPVHRSGEGEYDTYCSETMRGVNTNKWHIFFLLDYGQRVFHLGRGKEVDLTPRPHLIRSKKYSFISPRSQGIEGLRCDSRVVLMMLKHV